MPTYEYECKICSHRFEAFQAMSDEPIKKCPECGKAVRRLVSGGAGVIFKGSGFYVTDKDKSSVPKSNTGSKKDAAPTKVDAPKADASGDGSKTNSAAKTEAASPKGDTGSKGDASSGDGKKGKAKPAA
jgi:putative FmdB family regulatory protein